MAAYENLFSTSSEPKGQLTRNLEASVRVSCRTKIAQNSFRSEIKDDWHGGLLENLFCTSSAEPIGQLTRNLIGSYSMT